MIEKIKHLPKIGFGTFGNDKNDATVIADSVLTAIKSGYRLFDCASIYGNESQIGEIFNQAITQNLCTRQDLIVMSKVWNDKHGEGDIIASCKQSLQDLGLEYIDIYFVHWPFANYHAKGCTIDSRNMDSRPFFKNEFIKAWREMEWLKDNGFVREIAMSNMTIPKFNAVLPDCRIMPYAHEMELHPSCQQYQLVEYCRTHGMEIIGYCPIGSPDRPARDMTDSDVIDTDMPEVVAAAIAHNCHPVTICIKWAVQNGWTPIPFSSRESNIVSNLNAVVSNPLTDSEMSSINAADKNSKLVKGHVFLWNGARDWRDLWDMNGKLEDWVLQGKTWIVK